MFPSDSDINKPLDESTHSRFINKMLHCAGISSKASTHIARGCASRMAELAGVSEDQIRRLGHWQAGAMERHYLSALPRKGMRAMAGVGSTKVGEIFFKARSYSTS